MDGEEIAKWGKKERTNATIPRREATVPNTVATDDQNKRCLPGRLVSVFSSSRLVVEEDLFAGGSLHRPTALPSA